MTWKLPRSWLYVSAVAAVAVLALNLIVNRLTREPPNYSQIEDGLYIGGHVAKPPPGTRAVLSLEEHEDAYQAEVHRWQPIPDAEPAPSLDWLRQQVEFVGTQRESGRQVFVHCRAGVSRSGMVVVAYLMLQHGWSRDQTLEFVRSRRPIVRPNPAFMGLLLEWEESLERQGGHAGPS